MVKEGLKGTNESINHYLLSRLHDINHGDPWYGRNLNDLLSESYESPEILNILKHMIVWRKYVLSALTGGRPKIEINSAHDWPDSESVNLEAIVSEFSTTYQNLIESIKSFPEERWFEKLWHGEYHFFKLVNGLIDHDLYHMGQVVILSKSQKILFKK